MLPTAIKRNPISLSFSIWWISTFPNAAVSKPTLETIMMIRKIIINLIVLFFYNTRVLNLLFFTSSWHMLVAHQVNGSDENACCIDMHLAHAVEIERLKNMKKQRIWNGHNCNLRQNMPDESRHSRLSGFWPWPLSSRSTHFHLRGGLVLIRLECEIGRPFDGLTSRKTLDWVYERFWTSVNGATCASLAVGLKIPQKTIKSKGSGF